MRWAGLLHACAASSVGAAAAGAATASLVAAGVAAVICTLLLRRRARLTMAERAVWTRWALCAPPTALSAIAAWAGAPHLAALLVVAVFPLAYGAAVRWNRYATSLADPHEAINGVASVTALVAVTDLTAQLLHIGPTGLASWERVLLWAPVACAFIIFSSLAAIISVAGLIRDARAWLMLAATGTIVALTAGGLLHLPTAVGGPLLAAVAWCAGRAALLDPADVRPQPVDATDSTVGGFVILVVCTATLLVAALTGTAGPSTWLGAAAACLSAIRLLRNVQDIAALSTSRAEALTDDLTGVPNRRAVLRRADELAAAGEPMMLAIIDLDGFKHINDSLGHAAGDQLLRQVAARLRAAVPGSALLGRLGGDEFAVVGPVPTDTDPFTALDQIADDLLAALNHPTDISGFLLHGSGSIGLTATTGSPLAVRGPDAVGTSSATVSELLRQADAAMYEAKATRGTAIHYDPVRHAAHGQLQLAEELRTALLGDELLLHHQPQIDIGTGDVFGVEALIRWNHPTRGLLTPDAFLDLAESQGLMSRLTDLVLQQAVAQLAAWRDAGLALRMSVNLSASNLLDTGLPTRLTTLLSSYSVPASQLTLEVTETVLVQDTTSAAATLQSLADTGVELSIDDFGTGWSSLAYLRRLPARELKLDQSFTRNLLTDPRTAAIVASTILLAHELNLRVVAEGVEDERTLHQLRLLGCDLSQGFLHGRPAPADAITHPPARMDTPVATDHDAADALVDHQRA